MCNYLITYSEKFALINSAEKIVNLSLPLTFELRFDDDTRGSGR